MATTGSTISLLEHFSALADPRQAWKVVYPLPEILLLVLAATLAGADDFVEARLWGQAQLPFLRRFLAFRHGIPSHDTLNDVINALDPELFKTCFVTPPTPPASVPVGMEPQARLGRATARARARHRGDRWQDLAPQPRAGQGARAVASGLGPPAPLAPAAPQSDRPKADGRAANGWSSARRPWPGNPTRLRRSRCFWSAWRSPAPW